jgi:hypothetical protein
MTEPADPRPARWLAPAVLTLEGVLALLVVPAVAVSDRSHAGRSAALVGVLALALFIAAGLARRSTVPGWVCQAGLIATGLVSPVMWFLGVLFAAMYGGSLRLQDTRPYRKPPVA